MLSGASNNRAGSFRKGPPGYIAPTSGRMGRRDG
jgi:hypothetical protein